MFIKCEERVLCSPTQLRVPSLYWAGWVPLCPQPPPPLLPSWSPRCGHWPVWGMDTVANLNQILHYDISGMGDIRIIWSWLLCVKYHSHTLLNVCGSISSGRKHAANNEFRFNFPLIGSVLHLESLLFPLRRTSKLADLLKPANRK